MAGSPKKRARKKARLLEEAAGNPATLCPPAAGQSPAALPTVQAVSPTAEVGGTVLPPVPLNGEVLPPEPADVTRTALRRAMRARAQELAEEAITRLATAMRNEDDRIAVPAANAILDRAHGKPMADIEVTDGLTVTIIKFSESV